MIRVNHTALPYIEHRKVITHIHLTFTCANIGPLFKLRNNSLEAQRNYSVRINLTNLWLRHLHFARQFLRWIAWAQSCFAPLGRWTLSSLPVPVLGKLTLFVHPMIGRYITSPHI